MMRTSDLCVPVYLSLLSTTREINWTYVLPRTGSVVLGGTTWVGNWDESVNPDTAELIMSPCVSLIPSLCGAEAGLEGDCCEIL